MFQLRHSLEGVLVVHRKIGVQILLHLLEILAVANVEILQIACRNIGRIDHLVSIISYHTTNYNQYRRDCNYYFGNFFHILHFSAKQSAILQKNNVSTKKNLQHWRRFDNFVIYLTVSINSKYAGRKIPRQRSGTQRGLQRL